VKKNLYIKTYGCQMNVYDSQRMADILSPFGYALTEEPEQADIAILNTCHIREKAEQKVHSDLGRLRSHKVASVANGRNMIIAVGRGTEKGIWGKRNRVPFNDVVFLK
jgi:tRNA-2-methylthio-N6-dimethylallyladenosine synthase